MANPTPPPGGFQNGGWYSGQQYWNGQFGAPGVIINPNQQGAGQAVSNEVVKQTNPNNVGYIAKQSVNPANPVGVAPGQAGGGGVNGSSAGLSMPSAPTFDLVGATEAAYNTPEIKAAQEAVTKRQQALADASAGINDNPFYSEATRVGKQAQLTSQANNDIRVQQDLLSTLKADAAIKVNAATGQYNINNEAYKTALTNFNNLVSMGALDNASGQDIANLSIQTGIPSSMIQSIQATSKKKNNPVNVINSTDDAGNLNLIAVDSSGNVVSQTTIPGAGKGKSGSVADQKLADAQQTQQNLINDIQSAVTPRELVPHYGGTGGLSIEEIYRLYNAYSPWGPAQESLDEFKEGKFVS